ncbi:hypothetical protein [Halosimplex sp. TS25]|uniref:hypothetical protein n=1 Tax=Halosimplex rarum TaxID=3396619 RepID=UPI0039E959B4
MDGQNQRADRPDDRPEGAVSDLGIDSDGEASQAGADTEQFNPESRRFSTVEGDEEADGETYESVVTSIRRTVLVRTSAEESELDPTDRCDGMQSRLGLRPERVSRVDGCAISDVAAHRARSSDRSADRDEPDPCVAQASGYLARD